MLNNGAKLKNSIVILLGMALLYGIALDHRMVFKNGIALFNGAVLKQWCKTNDIF